jgi:hypothetical protein
MLPLSQPELKNIAEPSPGVIEAHIALRANQRSHAPDENEAEAGNSEKIKREVKSVPRDQPVAGDGW